VDVNLNSNRSDDYQSWKHNKTMIIRMDETDTKVTSIISIHKKTSPNVKENSLDKEGEENLF